MVIQCFHPYYPTQHISGHQKLISTYKMTILATKITQNGPLMPEIWHFLYRKEWTNFCLVVSDGQTNGFNGFQSKMVISYMLIGFMMTKNVLGWILEVKPLFKHQKLQGENLFTLCDTKNVIFQASVDHFEWFLWLKWSFYMCWLVLWWLEMCWVG